MEKVYQDLMIYNTEIKQNITKYNLNYQSYIEKRKSCQTMIGDDLHSQRSNLSSSQLYNKSNTKRKPEYSKLDITAYNTFFYQNIKSKSIDSSCSKLTPNNIENTTKNKLPQKALVLPKLAFFEDPSESGSQMSNLKVSPNIKANLPKTNNLAVVDAKVKIKSIH